MQINHCSRWFAVLTLMIFLGYANSADAQNRYDALRFSTFYPAQDAITIGFGGAMPASAFNAGGVISNPATASLIPNSGLSFSLSSRNINGSTTYQGQSFNDSDWQSTIGDLSLVYKFPVVTGDFTIGAGYTQLADFNRLLTYDVQNSRNTITDFFLQNSYYLPIAFEAFAIDDFDGTTDLFSVWREPFDFVGVRQEVRREEWGSVGEFNTFFATEFRENLFIGASLGIPTGTYNYRLSFLETPPNVANDYDVDAIYLEDEITARIRGANLRVGLLAKVNERLQIGASYATFLEYEISEDFDTFISTDFVTGDSFNDSQSGQNTYSISVPSRYNLGITFIPVSNITISTGAEFVDYSAMEMSGIGSANIDMMENRAIRNEFQSVVNLRAGIQAELSEQITMRGGFAYMPSPRVDFSQATQSFYSLGASLRLSEDVYFDLGAQLARWSDRNVMYEVQSGNNLIQEVAQEDVSRIHIMSGLRLLF